jgi:hypothetical protein
MVKEHIQREDEQTGNECEQRSCRNTEGNENSFAKCSLINGELPAETR